MIVSDRENLAEQLSDLSVQEFLSFGSDGLSYLKLNGVIDGRESYTLYMADGSHLASGQDLNALRIIAAEKQLVPMAVQ